MIQSITSFSSRIPQSFIRHYKNPKAILAASAGAFALYAIYDQFLGSKNLYKQFTVLKSRHFQCRYQLDSLSDEQWDDLLFNSGSTEAMLERIEIQVEEKSPEQISSMLEKILYRTPYNDYNRSALISFSQIEAYASGFFGFCSGFFPCPPIFGVYARYLQVHLHPKLSLLKNLVFTYACKKLVDEMLKELAEKALSPNNRLNDFIKKFIKIEELDETLKKAKHLLHKAELFTCFWIVLYFIIKFTPPLFYSETERYLNLYPPSRGLSRGVNPKEAHNIDPRCFAHIRDFLEGTEKTLFIQVSDEQELSSMMDGMEKFSRIKCLSNPYQAPTFFYIENTAYDNPLGFNQGIGKWQKLKSELLKGIRKTPQPILVIRETNMLNIECNSSFTNEWLSFVNDCQQLCPQVKFIYCGADSESIERLEDLLPFCSLHERKKWDNVNDYNRNSDLIKSLGGLAAYFFSWQHSDIEATEFDQAIQKLKIRDTFPISTLTGEKKVEILIKLKNLRILEEHLANLMKINCTLCWKIFDRELGSYNKNMDLACDKTFKKIDFVESKLLQKFFLRYFSDIDDLQRQFC